MPYLSIFLLQYLKKTKVIYEISILEFVWLQNSGKKPKYPNLEPKMPDLGVLGLEFENNIAIFEISTFKFF